MAILFEFSGQLPDQVGEQAIAAVLVALNGQVELVDVNGTINVKLTNDSELQELNNRYSGQDYATDVLSFSYIEDGGEPIEGTMGDVAISIEMAERQAKNADTDLATELALLVLHGVLHVLGYDHSEAAEREQLDGLQRQLMTQAGLDYRDFAWTS